jgi:hypothetical protein
MWQAFFADWLARYKHRSPQDKHNVAQAVKEAGGEYKNLSAEEKAVSARLDCMMRALASHVGLT